MCGRFVLYTPVNVLAERYWGSQCALTGAVPSYNVAPGSEIVAVRFSQGGTPLFELIHWGFKPRWAAEKAPAPINARIESLNSPYFRDAFQRERCVIPANGWYEWMKSGDGRKQAFYITSSELERDETLMFAGVCTAVGLGDRVRTAIVTEPAGESIRHIHDRQPVLIHPDSLDDWLDPERSSSELKGVIRRSPSDSLTWWQVSDEVNRPINNYESLLSPI